VKARVRTYRVLHFFDSGGVVVNSALLTGEVLDTNDDLVHTLVLNQNFIAPNLYLSDPVVFVQPGTYTVNWSYNAVLQLSEQLVVGFDPSSDFPLNCTWRCSVPFCSR